MIQLGVALVHYRGPHVISGLVDHRFCPNTMLRTLKTFFLDKLSATEPDVDLNHVLELACAALLLEVARAHDDVSAAEEQVIIATLEQEFAVTPEEMATLVDTARDSVEDAVSLYEFTSVVNEKLTRAQKLKLVECLWRVADVDGRIDHYEEYFVRRISDLIHVSHRDLVATKLRVIDGA